MAILMVIKTRHNIMRPLLVQILPQALVFRLYISISDTLYAPYKMLPTRMNTTVQDELDSATSTSFGTQVKVDMLQVI